MLAAVVIAVVVVSAVSVFGLVSAFTPSSPSGAVTQGSVYQVVDSNLTLGGQAAGVPCTGLDLGSCPTNATLTDVELISYGGVPYYLYSETLPNGGGTIAGGSAPTSVYTVWFTNSSVYCVSPAHPLTSTLVQNPTCPTVPYAPVTIDVPVATASTENATLGLMLGLSLHAGPGGSVNVTVDDYNVLGTGNNLTAANRWPIPGVEMFLWSGADTCGVPGNMPAGYAIFQGNYSLASLNGVQPLTTYAFPLLECPYEAPATYYAFYPHSYAAQSNPFSNIAGTALYNVTVDTACRWTPENGCIWSLVAPQSGYWTGSGTQASAGSAVDGGDCPTTVSAPQPTLNCPLLFNPFPPGTYTVLAGDEWGQAVVLHFTVSSG